MTVIGVIEWSSDSGIEPAVFLADSEIQLRKAVAEYLWPIVKTGDVNYIDAGWIAQNPEPDYADADNVKRWLDALHEATTDAWFSIYRAGDSAGSTTYHDLRA